MSDVNCPKCSGPMWDNRATKRNPKQPDFKCKDKSCEGVIWPPKGGAAAPAPAAAPQKQAYASGPHIPAIDGPMNHNDHAPYPLAETGAPPATRAMTYPDGKLDGLFNLYDTCFAHAYSLAQRTLGNDASHEGISAMAATIFIAAK